MLSFDFVEKEKLSARKIDFDDFDQVFFTAQRLSCFIKNFQVHFSHNGQINYTFKRKFAYLSMFHRCFIQRILCKEKLEKPRFVVKGDPSQEAAVKKVIKVSEIFVS